ncbi:hypothetical protein [Paracoccus aerodenitrificans]|uniref:hypothetical protein n=1 Tax=Paracoccus aerodenitrificans TaxID=3017781 RepID=UPI0022F101C4|nr:hypothetical protein [Paracoccus aerodenitrificans]WBU63132.1 hypothetical protein PAE61_12270 [Paracoccus aerodenitrificans]
MTIRIHIGVHKTATTELQYSLRRVSAKLSEAGTGYLGPRDLRDERFQLHAALREGSEDLKGACSSALQNWLSGHEVHLLSEENIIGTTHRTSLFSDDGRLYPLATEQLAELLELMGSPEVELFMAVRDPADFVTSAYGQQLRTGMLADLDGYLRNATVQRLSWTELAMRLLENDLVSRVVFWRYEDHERLRPHILEAMIGPDLAGIVPRMGWHNGGISQQAYDMLVKTALEDTKTPVRQLLQQARTAHPRKQGVPQMRLLPQLVHRRSRDAYAQDILKMAQLDRVTFLDPTHIPEDSQPA